MAEMSTKTKETTTQTATHTPLDAAIEATGRQASIRNTAAQFLGVPPDRACDLLRNVWRTSNGQPPLSDAEMFAGMSMIARFGLDPIAKEVYVTRTSKGLVTIIGIDGWVKILHRTEGYDGFEQELHFNGEELEWVETSIYSTRLKRPTKYKAFMREYAKIAGIVAKTIPWHMLRLFSLRHAARLFTPIGGSVVTEEEARWMDAYADTPADDRQRKNTLKEKVQSAAKEYEPIPETESESGDPVEPPQDAPPESHTDDESICFAFDQLAEALREAKDAKTIDSIRGWVNDQDFTTILKAEMQRRIDTTEQLIVNKGQRNLV